MIYSYIYCINDFHYLFLEMRIFLIYTKSKKTLFSSTIMDNADNSKFLFVLDDIRQQEDFLSYFKNKLNKENGVQCHLFDDILEFLSKIKEIVGDFLHVCQREGVWKLQREWLQ